MRHTSNLAFKSVNGFRRNPTAVRVVAPAIKFPPTVRDGRTEVLEALLLGTLRTSANWGE